MTVVSSRKSPSIAAAFLVVALSSCGSPSVSPPSTTASQRCAAVGCEVELLTQPQLSPGEGCQAARISGKLVVDSETGLGLMRNGSTRAVKWPNGFSARRDENGIVLLDRTGGVLAHEGDDVAMDGVKDADFDYPCWEPNLVVE